MSFKTLKKQTIYFLGFLILVTALSQLCYWNDTENTMGGFDTSNPLEAQLKGHTCSLYEDSQGLNHLKAKTDLMAVACFGYIHGRDRAWQMDYFRRVAQGRKSEILGSNGLKSDFTMRLMGLEERAQAIFRSMPQEQANYFWAYAWGVNRGFEQALANGAYEFQDLHYKPQAWQPVHTILLALLECFDQTRKSFENDVQENERIARYGEVADELFNPDNMPWDTSILKAGEYPTQNLNNSSEDKPLEDPRKEIEKETDFAKLLIFWPEENLSEGSNNWVVSPERSKTGHALLANDPHLSLKHPPFWHWSHIQSDETFNFIGASLPGIPFITSGSNEHVAWGLTNAYMDVGHISFVNSSELKNMVNFRPWVWVKFWRMHFPIFFKTLHRTADNLPILPIETPQGKVAVLSWSGFEMNNHDFEKIPDLMRAHSVAEADQIFASLQLPSWNFVFADDEGHIGYRTTGKVPYRAKAPDYGISSRSASSFEQKTVFFSSSEMPHVINPIRGYIATANNRQWPMGAPFHAGRAHQLGFRAFRIEELLTARPQHDISSFQDLQCDVQATDARFLVTPLVKAIEPLVGDDKESIQALGFF